MVDDGDLSHLREPSPTVRAAGPDDLAPIVAIYNHHVRTGFATFDESEVSVADRRAWFEQFDTTGPHRLLVVTAGDEVVGYAGSMPYRPHRAFRHTVELTVYLAADRAGQGLGTQLYERLFGELTDVGLHRAVAGIALPNDASVGLHRRFGFEEIGVFDEYALKHDRWISSVWMQRRF